MSRGFFVVRLRKHPRLLVSKPVSLNLHLAPSELSEVRLMKMHNALIPGLTYWNSYKVGGVEIRRWVQWLCQLLWLVCALPILAVAAAGNEKRLRFCFVVLWRWPLHPRLSMSDGLNHFLLPLVVGWGWLVLMLFVVRQWGSSVTSSVPIRSN